MVFRISRSIARVGVVVAALVPVYAVAQGGGGGAPGAAVPPEVRAAQAAFNAGHADSAIATLEGYFQRNPNAVVGRLLLGNAYASTGDVDKAIAAYERVTQPRPSRLQALYQIAGLEAKRGHADTALALLRVLKASGAFDMDQAKPSAELASVRGDPRFAAAMFHPEEFAKPFVEPVRVIHEWIGETKGDQFSWIARGIGDVDGDRANDVVASAPSFDAKGRPAGKGKVYVYSGKSGKLLWARVGADGENLGSGLEGAGDVNHDGVGDVIAGAPGSGRAYVYSGRDGATLLTLTGTVEETFGNATAGAGDQNGDGYADVIVGAPTNAAAGQGAGRAYVFSGKDGAPLATLSGERAGDAFGSIVAGDKWGKRTPVIVGAPGAGARTAGRIYKYATLDRPPAVVIEADSTGVALGAMFTSLVGDVNGDKIPDVYATDFTNAAKGPSTGRAYITSGADGRRLYTLTGEQPGDAFGVGSADVGDVNRDGYDDLLVGAWQYARVVPSGGRIYLYSGKDGSLLRTLTARIPGETLGFDAAGVGDVDGDGVPDLLVASSWSNIHGYRSGRFFIVSGK